jgi:hypothetical protein
VGIGGGGSGGVPMQRAEKGRREQREDLSQRGEAMEGGSVGAQRQTSGDRIA